MTGRGRRLPSFCIVSSFHVGEGRGGGAEVQAWLLARELARRGHRVDYVAQSVTGRAGRSDVDDGVTVRWVPYAHHFRWRNGPHYYRAIAASDADIVVQRMTSFVTGVAGRYCRRRGKPFVWICTDNANPVRWFFTRRQLRINRERSVLWLKRPVFLANAVAADLSRHYGMKCVTTAFTQNEEQRSALYRAYGMRSRRMISGQEVPDDILPPGEKLKRGIVLWVANLGEHKRPEQFIELARAAGDRPLRFVMIGGAADREREANMTAGAPANVELKGRLSLPETLSWFDRAAFLVNTSSIEGFPSTFIEAWLRGVPVLTTGVDPDGVITKQRLGRVCRDTREVLAAVDELAAPNGRYGDLSARVLQYALEHHTVKTMTDAFLAGLGGTDPA